jgi:ethanolamine kinase
VIIEREWENDLFAKLSRLGFAPAYLGRFTNGRVEGYMEAASLSPEQMAQTTPVDLCGYIGRELARMHSMEVECDRTPLLWDKIHKWAQLAAGEWLPARLGLRPVDQRSGLKP